MGTGYIIEEKQNRRLRGAFRRLSDAKAAFMKQDDLRHLRIVAINEYQGYIFEGPHIYYLEHDGAKFFKIKI